MTIALVLCGVLAAALTAAQTSAHLISQRASYIVGGSEALPHEFPWLVSLQEISQPAEKMEYHSCAGSIINEQWVVTAAHCLQDGIIYRVIAGAHDISRNETDTQVFDIDLFIMHPNYNRTSFENDIALIKIVGSFPLDGETISAIRLPLSSDGKEFDCSTCTSMGWGSTLTDKLSTVLLKVNLPMEKLYICAMLFKQHSVTEKNLCAGSLISNWGDCDGDSGGSLACLSDGVYTLAGVINFGFVLCEVNAPQVYAKVSAYRDWIDHHISNGGDIDDVPPISLLLVIGAVALIGLLCAIVALVCCAKRSRMARASGRSLEEGTLQPLPIMPEQRV